MKPFSKITGVVAVLLGIAGVGSLAADPVPQPDASAVARARAAFIKKMSSHRPNVRSTVTAPASSAGVTGGVSYKLVGLRRRRGRLEQDLLGQR